MLFSVNTGLQSQPEGLPLNWNPRGHGRSVMFISSGVYRGAECLQSLQHHHMSSYLLMNTELDLVIAGQLSMTLALL